MDPNIQTAQQTAQQAIQQKKSSVKIFWIYLIAILLAIALGISGYFIGFEQALGKKLAAVPKAPAPAQPKLPIGFQRAQASIKANPGLLTSTRITQYYQGKLISFVPEKSWTLEKKGKTVIINNETNNPIRYNTKIDGPKITYQSAATAPFKLGDEVVITTFIRLNESKLNVDAITLVLPPQNPLPTTSSSAAAQK